MSTTGLEQLSSQGHRQNRVRSSLHPFRKTSGFKGLLLACSVSTPACIPVSPSWLEPNRRKAWPISTSRVNAFFRAPTDTSFVHRITWPKSLVSTC